MTKQTNAISNRIKPNVNRSISNTKLNHWLNTVTQSNGFDSNQLFAVFGINTPLRVIQYLKSPAGKTMLAEIRMDIENEQAFIEKMQLDQELALRKKHRRILFLILGLLYMKEARAEHIKEAALQHELDLKRQPLPEAPSTTPTVLTEQIKHLEEAIIEMESSLDDHYKESVEIERALVNVNSEHESIEFLHDLYHVVLNEEDIHLALADPSTLEKAHELNQQRMSSYAAIIAGLDHKTEPQTVSRMHAIRDALLLKSMLIQQLSSVHQGERVPVNRNGQRVDQIDQADFLIPKDKTLALEGSTYFLFPQRQSFAKLSLEQRREAIAAFEQAKEELVPIKNRLQLQRDEVLARHEDKKAKLMLRSEQKQKDIYDLTTQLSKVKMVYQAARNQLAPIVPVPAPALLRHPVANARPTMSTTAPQPTGRPEPTQQAPVSQYLEQSYLHMERLMTTGAQQNPTALAKQRLQEIQRLLQNPQPQPIAPDAPETPLKITPSPFNKRPRRS